MRCDWVQHHLDDYELGGLTAPEREALEQHVASCDACRRLLAEARAADEAVRAALAWAEPGPEFAARLAAAAARPRRRWWRPVAAAAAVAAVACLAVLHALLQPPPTPDRRPLEPPREQLLGAVHDIFGQPVERLEVGRAYVAAAPTTVGVGDRSLFVLGRGSEFASAGEGSGGMTVHSGAVLGQVASQQDEVSVELAPHLGGAVVRTRGCHFYSTGASVEQLLRGEALPECPGAIRVHVYTGALNLELGAQKLELEPGDSAILWGGVSAGPTHQLEAQVERLRQAVGEETLAKRTRYLRLQAQYADRLRELRAAREAADPERVALVAELLRTHTAALERLEAAHPELAALDAALAELDGHDALREEADRALAGFVTLVCSAR